MRKTLLILFLLISTFSANGFAQTITIGAGTSMQRFPFNYYYGYGRSAIIYTSSEISGTVDRNISKIRFYSNLTSGFVTGPTIIYVQAIPGGTTTQTSVTFANKIASAIQVYSGTPNWVNGWNEFDINDFIVPAGMNLEVIIRCDVTGTGTGGDGSNAIRYTTATNTHQYWQDDGSPPLGTGTISSNRANIQIDTGAALTIDVGVVNVGFTGNQYYTSTTVNPKGEVKNFATGSRTFVVTRKITPGGYTSTKTVTNLAPNTTQVVSFDPWVFTDGVTYSVKDSTYLSGDQNPSNDTLSGVFIAHLPKTVAILNADQRSTDSLMSHMNASGYAGKYDVLTSIPNISFSAWQTLIVLLPSGFNWSALLRDSMKSFLDNSTVGLGKKSLMIFSNDLGYYNDPISNEIAPPADTLFYRQYMRAMYWNDNWLEDIPAADSGFTGANAFSGLTNNYVTGNYPDYVKAINGGSPAFVPNSLTGTDTCNAVYYGSVSTPYNIFYGTNEYWAYRPSTDIIAAPINVFQKISQWVEASGGVMPVELASFSANVSNRDVNLKWITNEELNNSGFDIERKSAEGTWSKIGFVEGSGTTTQTKSYSFNDMGLSTGKYNYRLKQIDFNGNYEYHVLSSEVNVGVPNKFGLSQNYPNPFNPVTKINYDLPVDGKIMLKVYDITGREIAQLVNEIQIAGYYTASFNASNFASGVYFYKLFANGNNGQQYLMTKKMMLIK